VKKNKKNHITGQHADAPILTVRMNYDLVNEQVQEVDDKDDD
jgi:hypothetical protein